MSIYALLSSKHPDYPTLKSIFPSGTAPVQSLVPSLAIAGPDKKVAEFYMLDVPRLHAWQFCALAHYLAHRGSMSVDEAINLMEDKKHGVPLLAEYWLVGIPARMVL